jgi:hypothetical protein
MAIEMREQKGKLTRVSFLVQDQTGFGGELQPTRMQELRHSRKLHSVHEELADPDAQLIPTALARAA